MKTTLKKYGRICLSILIYILFFIIIIHVWYSQNNIFFKIGLTCVMLFVLSMNLLFEFLKYLNEQCQIALVVSCDLKEVQTLMNRIKKYDLLKGMKPSLILTETLYLIDSNQPQACIDHIQKNQKFFSGHPDYLLIQYHSLFKSYALLNDGEHAQEAYTQLQRFKQTGKKKNHISQLYNWHEIDAILNAVQHQYKKSLDAYKTIDLKYYNNRECIHYYFGRALTEIMLKHRTNIRKYIKNIQNLNPDSPFIAIIEAHYETI